MSTIPIQNLIIDDDTDIGLTSDLVNGNFKTSSLTDLSNNIYTKIFDLSSNLNSSINTKENILSFQGPMSKVLNIVSIDLSNYASNSSLSNYALNSSLSNYALNSSLSTLNASNITSGTLSVSRGGIGTTTLTANRILIGNGTTSILQSPNLSWNNTSNTLSATNFVGSGSGITNLDYNNIATNKPDLTLYPLKTYVDGSLNTINTSLGTKQNTLTFSSPLINTSKQ